MTPEPQQEPRGPRRHVWPRVLVLLLALLLPGTHAEALTGPTATVPGENTTVEYDLFDTAPRPPARAVRRTAAPPGPAPLPEPVYAPRRPVPVPAKPYDPRPLCSEVLRC
ncbi:MULTISPECIES: hypothetical protein [unclassified Streptomyces]|uniref:hypothetical protein n=1 Tax=unclassified Streptomyces TaxID=2593676 RepID=UPI0036EC2EE2